jgi:hypothetical protein
VLVMLCRPWLLKSRFLCSVGSLKTTVWLAGTGSVLIRQAAAVSSCIT